MSIADCGSSRGYAPTRIVYDAVDGSVRSTIGRTTGDGAAATGASGGAPIASRWYKNALTPTAIAHASNTTAVPATNCARCASHAHGPGVFAGCCTSRLSAAWSTMATEIR